MKQITRWYITTYMSGLLNNDDIIIRAAKPDEWEDAMELVWNTFVKYEAPTYGKEGSDIFLKFISGEELYQMFINGDYKVAVAMQKDRIVGVGSMRSHNHVSLLFVDSKLHKRGIGRNLLEFMQATFLGKGSCVMSVNAAPYAVNFYKKVGFVATDVEQCADGITFQPMMILTPINNDRGEQNESHP